MIVAINGQLGDLINSIFFMTTNNSLMNLIGMVCYIFIFIGCYSKSENNSNYHQGEPIILKKEYSLIPGLCTYTYEGYGRIEIFEDKCNKYSVGGKL
jgi:hypothetical protein